MEEHLYKTFYEIEKKHWWFVGRQQIVGELIRQRLRLPSGSKVLDVGCGTGSILEMLSREHEAYGTDTSPIAIELCGQRGLKNAHQCSLDSFPYPDIRFDLITLLDVIEHVDDDLEVLRQAYRFLSPGGAILVTVPAYQWLWSKHDAVNHHKRRYAKTQLRGVLDAAGFRIEMLSYYNAILFPIALVQRLAEHVVKSEKDTTLDIPPLPINSLLLSIFSSEKYLLRRSSLPFGLSVVAIGRRG